MKIFLSFLQSNQEYPIPSYSFWEYYIKNGIEEAGHKWDECTDVDWALGLVPQNKTALQNWKQRTWETTVDYLKKNPADIFLSYLYPHQIDEDAIGAIQRSGIPCVNFFCDHVRDFKDLPNQFRCFNLNWVPEYKAVKLYEDKAAAYIHLPMPMWVPPSQRHKKNESNKQITFIGSRDIQRTLMFENLLSVAPDISLKVYGKGWENISRESDIVSNATLSKKIRANFEYIKNQGILPGVRKFRQGRSNKPISQALVAIANPPLPFELYNRLISESMITLGVNRYPSFLFPLDTPDSYSRLRDIEAPMLGACYLTEWTEGIDRLYDLENEILAYKNIPDLISKVKHLENSPALRAKLRANGQERALRDHTIPNSLQKIVLRLGL